MKKISYLLLFIFVILLVGCEMPTTSNNNNHSNNNQNQELTYSINYNLQGGSFEDDPVLSFTAGEEVVLSIPTYYSHRFLGWYDIKTDEPIDKITAEMNSDIYVYAKWEHVDIIHQINYHLDGGTLKQNAPTTYVEGVATSLGQPLKSGYLFRGWYQDENYQTPIRIDENTKGDLELYAKWEAIDLTNLTIGILGDSISTFYAEGDAHNSLFGGDNQFYYPRYCPEVDASRKCWWMIASNTLGATMLVNNSYSGGTVQGTGMSSGLNTNRLLKFYVDGNTYPDICLVLLGMNDAIGGADCADFIASYKQMLEKLNYYCPNMQLFICLIPYETYTNGQTRTVYNSALRELAGELEYPVIDFSTAWGSDTEVKNNWYYLHDNVHPGLLGMQKMASIVVDTVKAYYLIQD